MLHVKFFHKLAIPLWYCMIPGNLQILDRSLICYHISNLNQLHTGKIIIENNNITGIFQCFNILSCCYSSASN